jgi:hypothetical protein
MTTVGIADLNSYHETTSTLLVTHEGKEAPILLQGLAPIFGRESRQEICRRGMLQLVEALSEWKKSGAPNLSTRLVELGLKIIKRSATFLRRRAT